MIATGGRSAAYTLGLTTECCIWMDMVQSEGLGAGIMMDVGNGDEDGLIFLDDSLERTAEEKLDSLES